jgi:hypothetical protein
MAALYLGQAHPGRANPTRHAARALQDPAVSDWSGWSPESFLGVLAAVSGGTVAGRSTHVTTVSAR